MSLEKFSGPLQLLLELIERDDLPITDVSLARVADDYVAYVNAHDVPAEELADFLVIAAKLLLLKSNAILPAPEIQADEDPGKLAMQLCLYREFIDAAKEIEALYASGRISYVREKSLAPIAQKFVPDVTVTYATITLAFENLLKRLEPFFALKEASMQKIVSVQERIRDIQRAILERARMSFGEIVSGASRAEVVVSFLALLELVKQRVVHAAQSSAFEEIVLKRVK